MGATGPAAKPYLAVVREGGKVRGRHRDQVVIPAGVPKEPDWALEFPAANDATRRMRFEAHAEWERIVPPLAAHRVLTEVDRSMLVDHCTAWAELRECIRTVSMEGHVIAGDRGSVRHPASMTAMQLRAVLAKTTVQLGLTPAARARMQVARPDGGADGDDGDPFD